MCGDLLVGPFAVEYEGGMAPRLDEYRLRYRVFVEEQGWLANVSPDHLERDEFDTACCSVLLRDADTREAVACQRLILPERLPDGMRTQIERQYQPQPGAPIVAFARLPRASWAEVSRTTVAGRHWGAAATRLPAMVALTYATAALAVTLGRTTLFSMSELRMARLVRRLGFVLRQVGSEVSYHGRRAPFSIDVHEALSAVPPEWSSTMYRLIVGAVRVVSDMHGDDGYHADHAA